MKNVGLIALEDPETGEIVWVDTGSKTWQKVYSENISRLEKSKKGVFRKAKVDYIGIGTNEDYTVPLTSFFRERARRLRH